MDLVSLFQAGIKNVVASSGTSLTDEQVQLLSRFTKNIIILFDADPAGQKASLRSIEILLKQNFEVKVLSLPKGEDPDSYINNYGKENFDEIISSAKNFLEYQTAQFEEQGMFEDPAKATDAIRELVNTLALVNDELKRNMLLKTISKKFNLREKLIESELNNALQQRSKNTAGQFKPVQKEINVTGTLPNVSVIKNENPYEKELIRLLYSGNEEIVEYILEKIGIENFANTNYKTLAEVAARGYDEHKISPSYLIDKIDDEELRSFIFKLTLTDETISKKWDDLSYNGKIEKDTFTHAKETVRSFLVHEIEKQIKTNNAIIAESKDERLFVELFKRNQELHEEKKALLIINSEVSHEMLSFGL
jgi:DNA primase